MGSGTVLLGIALDDPSRTPPDRCRYDVGIIIREGERLPLDTRRVRGGRYAVFEIPHTEREVSRFWEDLERLTAEMCIRDSYGTATLEDILRDHVAPYGIELSGEASLPAVSPFSVSTGSSEWAVLYEFAQYCGGVCPRFDRAGRLVLKGWTEVENLAISDATPVTSLTAVSYTHLDVYKRQVGPCSAGDKFCGVALSNENGCAGVQVKGFCPVAVTGSIDLGWNVRAADGAGGVQTATAGAEESPSGVECLVVSTDTAGKRAVICL